MTHGELTEILYRLEVPSDIYRLDGSHFELAHVLARRNSKWVIFLSERGSESDSTEFENEHDACVHFLGRVCLELIERDMLVVGAIHTS